MSRRRASLTLPLVLVLLLAGCWTPDGPGIRPTNPGGSGSDGSDGDTDTDLPTDDTGDTDLPTDDTGDTGDDTGDPVKTPPTRPAVVLFIGDGMGPEHVRGGGLYKNGVEGSLVMETAPHQAWLRTASYTGYTDSAASATSYATGVKTWNGVLGMDHDVEPVPNVMEQAVEAGYATGIVTTDELAGATPSAFVVHQPARFDKVAIAGDWIDSPPDLAFAGGSLLFEPLLAEAGINGIFDKTELAALTTESFPVMGLFAEITFPYIADGYADTQPSLAEMVDAALTLLEQDEEGFVLIVEGARIDHASHSNKGEKVHDETVAYDDAVAVAVERLAAWEEAGRDATVMVTADHECGGIAVGEGAGAGEVPETAWRWGDHTNADVPLYAWGPHLDGVHGERLDNTAVYGLLQAALFDIDAALPEVPSIPDGHLDDLGDVVVIQTQATDFGEGFTQLDGLRLTADDWGLKVGIDGVFNDDGDAVLVWIDLDYGAGTGVGADLLLTDTEGELDSLLTAIVLDPELAGLGFDASAGMVQGEYRRLGDLGEESGLRTFSLPDGASDDLSWEHGIFNIDSGNLTHAEQAATDAAATGVTEHGLEIWLPWSSLYGDDGLASEGASLAVFAHALNDSATTLSNQALPPFSSETAPEPDDVVVSQVAVIEVDGTGTPLGEAVLAP